MSTSSPRPDSPVATGAVVHATPPARKYWTVEDWLNLPEEGPECWVSDGVLHFSGSEENNVTWRNPRHCVTTSRISYWLQRWLYEQPEPRGEVLSGEAAFQLSEGLGVGIDVAYAGVESAASFADVSRAVPGAPILAVEVLSPNDRHLEVTNKVGDLLKGGAAHVWVVDPIAKTVVVYRPDEVPKLFTIRDEIDAEPHLPGFRAPVKAFFWRG